ncbi:hypothetical protein PHYC_01373 [Phycisphaerales bacterium]|nr:hypothetical protein PHYC_01373 [Phycisphaerales bacterium]
MPDVVPSKASREDGFYVGYLPVPGGVRTFLKRVLPLVVCVVVVGALVLARSQRDPGGAAWDSATVSASGRLVATPYPALLVNDRGDGRPGTVLLVETGKHGLARAEEFHNHRVTVSGRPLRRDARFILEVDPGPDAVKSLPDDPSRPIPVIIPLGRMTLRGEIVDSKCYHGAMKPGDGKTHKECATLCIAGGIPPLFLTAGPQGETTLYLLADPSGGPLSPAALPFVGDPVELSGEAATLGGDLPLLLVAPGDIRRL